MSPRVLYACGLAVAILLLGAREARAQWIDAPEGWVATRPSAARPAALVAVDPAAELLPAPEHPGATRVRRIAFDPASIERLHACDDRGFDAGGLVIELFDGEPHALRVDRWLRDGPRSIRAAGDVLGRPGSSWTMVTLGPVVVLNLRLGDGRLFGIRYGRDGRPIAIERPEGTFECGHQELPPTPRSAISGASPPTAEAGGGLVFLSVLVGAFPNSIATLGGPLAAKAKVLLALEEGNTIFFNSGIQVRWTLAGFVQVEGLVVPEFSLSTYLQAIALPFDGFVDELHEYRRVLKADCVSVLMPLTGNPAGNAYVPPLSFTGWDGPFSTVKAESLLIDFALPHELGHNLGGLHDLATTVEQNDPVPKPPLPNAYGWRFLTSSGPRHTVMAYGDGAPVPFYSDASQAFEGGPLGNASLGADLATSIELFRQTYAGYGELGSPVVAGQALSYCQFGFGGLELGTLANPFDLVMESVLHLDPSSTGTVFVRGGGATPEAPLLLEPLLLRPEPGSPSQPFLLGQ